MPSALEDYMTRMGLGSSTTGSLGLDVPPPREVPKFTKFGDRMAALGGFGDQPGELKTLEELQKMSQEEIDEYKKKRAKARGQGVAETLIRIGEAFQGKPASANALARQQQRQIIESQNLARQKFNEAYATANPAQRKLMDKLDPLTWDEASKTYSAKKLFGEEKDRRIVQGPDGFNYYVNPDGTFERVLPGLEKPKKEETPSQQIREEELAVLRKIKSLQDQVDAGTLILEEGEQIIDKLNQYEKLILQSYISRPQQQDSFAAFAQYLSGQNDDDLIIKKVE